MGNVHAVHSAATLCEGEDTVSGKVVSAREPRYIMFSEAACQGRAQTV